MCEQCTKYSNTELRGFENKLPKPAPDGAVAAGTDRSDDRAAAFAKLREFTDFLNDPDNAPVDDRDDMFEMLRSSLQAIPEKYWSRLGIGYGNVGGEGFPESNALAGLGPQGEPLVHRFSEDQPRDADGKFGSGASDKEASSDWTGTHAYHATSLAALKEIKESGKILPSEGMYGKGVYFAPTHDAAKTSSAKDADVVLRVKMEDLPKDFQSFSEQGWTSKSISTDKVSYSKDGGKTWYHFPTERAYRFNEDQPRDKDGKFGSGSSADKIDADTALRDRTAPTAEQKELRDGYKQAFSSANATFAETASRFGSVTGRVKDVNSIAEKMATNETYIGKPLSALQDVVGLRCTCATVQDVRDCVAALQTSGLKIIGSPDNKMDVAQGFYRAVHIQFDSMGENKFGERTGEIQVRTERQGNIAMWGHDVAYKGPFSKDADVQAYAKAVSNAAWELDNGRQASFPDKVPAALAERDLGFKPDKIYTDSWLTAERGAKYWEHTS